MMWLVILKASPTKSATYQMLTLDNLDPFLLGALIINLT